MRKQTLKELWFIAKGYRPYDLVDIALGKLPKDCYLCGREEDWLLGLYKLVCIYGEVEEHPLDLGDGKILIWHNCDSGLVDFATGPQDCLRYICAWPGCFFDNGVTVCDCRSGIDIIIPPRPCGIVFWLYDAILFGYATIRFCWFCIMHFLIRKE